VTHINCPPETPVRFRRASRWEVLDLVALVDMMDRKPFEADPSCRWKPHRDSHRSIDWLLRHPDCGGLPRSMVDRQESSFLLALTPWVCERAQLLSSQ
jgi:hypothetical protein